MYQCYVELNKELLADRKSDLDANNCNDSNSEAGATIECVISQTT